LAKHGGTRHLKRLSAPAAIPVARKEMVWLKKTRPGPHARKASATLSYFVRDALNLAENFREAKRLIKNGEVVVDGVQARDEKRPVGLMDVLSFPKIKTAYRILLVGQRLFPVAIPFEQSSWKYCKIKAKRIAKKGKVQLVFHDGRSILVDREKSSDFKPGDSVKLSVPKQSIKAVLKREKGALCYIPFGKHSGEVARLVEILERKGSESNNALLKAGGKELITLQDYLFVVDEDFDLKSSGEVKEKH